MSSMKDSLAGPERPFGLARPTKGWQFLLLGIAYLAGPILVLLILARVDQPYQLDERYRISPDAYVVSMAAEPPTTGWQTDPELFPVERGSDEDVTSVWFRYSINRDTPVLALYFPFPLANLDIWYQQSRLATLGTLAEPLPYYRSPFLTPLPSADQAADSSSLYVRVVRHARRTNPPDAYLAPFDAAQRDYDSQHFVLDTLPQAMLIIMAVFGAIVFALFLTGREIRACGWYSLMILLWSLNTAHRLVDEIPLELPIWFALGYLCLNWIVVELFFINRFFSIPAPRMEQVALGISALVGIALLATAAASGFEAMNIVVTLLVNPLSFACAVLVTTRYFVALRRDWTYESLCLWLMSGVFIGVGVRDILYHYAVPWVPGSNFYLQYVAVLPISLFGWYLIRRFAAALKIANLRTEELDATVAQRTTELEESYATLAEEQQRRSIEAERSRLMRDMHDGLGGQLVHALALSEQGSDKDLQNALRDALSDLRMVVDSLAPDTNGVQELLAAYRHRLTQSLDRNDTQLVWDIDDIDDSSQQSALNPKQALNVLRILQEAVTNAVRHSQCKAIAISLTESDSGVTLKIVDDGVGFDDVSKGRGLQNMRVRAREIGATLQVLPSPEGTTVTCDLGLGPAELES